MKTTLKILFGLAGVSLAVFMGSSCAREDVEVGNAAPPLKESAIQKHIADHQKERTRSGGLVDLEPVIYEGDTVMYIANYGDGWEVFSNSTTMPMVLMRSETGRLDAASLKDNPAFAAFFEMTKENLAAEMHDASAEAQPGSEEWAFYGVQNLKNTPLRKPAPETMVLVGIGDNVSTKTERIEHLIKTRWDQESPYNQYIPFSKKEGEEKHHVAAGCSAVAAAQYLYYYHYKTGLPAVSVTKATYSSSTNSYDFSETNTSVWDNMTLGNGFFTPSLTEASSAALLIGNVANCINTEFACNCDGGSSSNTQDVATYVSQETKQNLKVANFSTSTVYNLINQSQRPVMTCINRTDTASAHLIIIDDVNKVTYGKEQFYAPSSALANVQNPTIHYGATLESMRALYGNGVTCEIVYSSTSYYFRANWGWGSSAADPEISGSLLTVSYGKRNYKAVTMIY